jgi:hypothetical protein
MTNPFLSDQGAGLEAELAALAPTGGKQRPVKVVEHPAFARSRRLLAQAEAQAFTVFTLPVVSLDLHPAPPMPDCCSMAGVA